MSAVQHTVKTRVFITLFEKIPAWRPCCFHSDVYSSSVCGDILFKWVKVGCETRRTVEESA